MWTYYHIKKLYVLDIVKHNVILKCTVLWMFVDAKKIRAHNTINSIIQNKKVILIKTDIAWVEMYLTFIHNFLFCIFNTYGWLEFVKTHTVTGCRSNCCWRKWSTWSISFPSPKDVQCRPRWHCVYYDSFTANFPAWYFCRIGVAFKKYLKIIRIIVLALTIKMDQHSIF